MNIFIGETVGTMLLVLLGDKADSGWSYAWIPVVGPSVGGLMGALFYSALFSGLSTLSTP